MVAWWCGVVVWLLGGVVSTHQLNGERTASITCPGRLISRLLNFASSAQPGPLSLPPPPFSSRDTSPFPSSSAHPMGHSSSISLLTPS